MLQSEVGMAVLQAQLRHAKVLLPHETIQLHRVFAAQRRCAPPAAAPPRRCADVCLAAAVG